MTKNILFIYLLLQMCLLRAQIGLEINQTFSPGTNLSGQAYKIIEKDNSFLILSFAGDTITGHTLYSYTKKDTLGNIIWQKKYDYPNYFVFQARDFITNSNSLYSFGVMYKDTINDYDWFLSKHNSSGDTLFVKTFVDTASLFPLQILQTNNNELSGMLIETHKITGSLYARAAFVKLDTNGTILIKKYTPYNLKQPQILLYDSLYNKYYVLGTYRTSAYSNYNVKYYIETYDQNFNLITSKNISSSSSNERMMTAILHNHIIYYTSSWMTTQLPNPNLFSQIRFNSYDPASGSVFPLNYHNVGPYDLYDVIYTTNIKLLPNGLMSFFIWEPGTFTHLVFADTSTQIVCQSLLLQDPYQQNTLGTHTYLNGAIYSVGGYRDTLQSYLYKDLFIKTNNYNGYLRDSCSFILLNTSDLNISKIDLNIFPNPARDIISITMNKELELNFNIYDVLGKNVLNGSVSQKSNTIPLINFINGIYFVIFSNSDFSITKKIIIEK